MTTRAPNRKDKKSETDQPKAGPGPNNDITDVPGVLVGQAVDEAARTGVTVVAPARPAIVAGDVRGGGPGTRETDLLAGAAMVSRADAIVLSGGSSYGLGAADGVAAALGAAGRGYQLIARDGAPPSPIVPAAILYDLANGGDKNWGERPPYFELGRQAFHNRRIRPVLGRAGAGIGAGSGDGPGGLGSASFVTADGIAVGAIVAVNSFGSVRMPGSDAFWAWPYEIDREFGGARPGPDWRMPDSLPDGLPGDTKLAAASGSASGARANTTIGVVAVNAPLSPMDAERVAVMAQDGLARAIRPVHAPFDGDALFVLALDGAADSTAANSGASPAPVGADPMTVTRIGSIAADVVARAIARGVYEASKTQE